MASNLPEDNFNFAMPMQAPFVRQTLGEPRFHTEGDIAAVSFAPDGTIYSVDDAGILRHWDSVGHCLQRFFLSDLETHWCFSPDGSLLASGSNELELWNVKQGTLLQKATLRSWLTALAFSHEGKRLAVGHDDGTVTIWDTQAFQVVLTCKDIANNKAISALCFSHNGKHLAVAAEDRVVRVIDAESGAVLFQGQSHTDRVPSLAWSQDDSLLVSAGWDTSARVWKLDETDPLILLNSHAEQVHVVAFHPSDPKFLATADSDFDIYLWTDARYGKVGQILRGHIDEIRSLSFSPDGTKLASAGADRVVHLWDVNTGQLLAGPNPKGKHAIALAELAGQTLLVSTGGPTVRAWELSSGKPSEVFEPTAAYSVAASPDGKLVAVGGVDHFTRLYDMTQPLTTPRLLEATKPPIGSMAVSLDGTLVAHTSPADGLVWIWTATTAEPMLILIEAADGCTLEGVAFLPDRKHVVVGGIDYLSTGERDGAVCIWNLETKEKTRTFDFGVYAVAVDHTGRFVAGAGLAEKVYLWDLTTEREEPIFTLEGHTERILGVTFSPDGSYLVSSADDHTLRIWDVLSGRLLAIREFTSEIQALVFSRCGKFLYTGHADTTCAELDFSQLLND